VRDAYRSEHDNRNGDKKDKNKYRKDHKKKDRGHGHSK
jgi:hypothetical protein